ncbi:MAG: cation diffusion facilitator family transporter [Lachnoclostridium sp.]|nr:cation diffusion facilitator family transporter [Lachnospira sp.]MCM1247748.1 cation diffusion facilitator family transporter [Lachnoclostridium sp.]
MTGISESQAHPDAKGVSYYMERSRRIIRISIISLVVNLMLVGCKAFVGFLTGSVAVVMDAVNNLSDALSSVITIVGTGLASKDPDRKHPYGYGRVEYVAAVTIGAIVLWAGLTSFKEAFLAILHPEASIYPYVSLLIITAGVFVKFFMGRYVIAQGKKYHSQSLTASGREALFDCAISLSTLLAAGISLLFRISVEGWFGAVIAAFIIKAGVEVLAESLNGIIGSRVERELSAELKQRICRYPQVYGAYDLILHKYGPEQIMGAVRVEVPENLTAGQLHYLFRSIADDVYKEYGIILTVGLYAANTADLQAAQMKDTLSELIGGYSEILQMHGFYADMEQMTVTFDLVMDFHSVQKQQIREKILQDMGKRYPQYRFSAVLEHDFSD